jgi:YD repeat-containing protein
MAAEGPACSRRDDAIHADAGYDQAEVQRKVRITPDVKPERVTTAPDEPFRSSRGDIEVPLGARIRDTPPFRTLLTHFVPSGMITTITARLRRVFRPTGRLKENVKELVVGDVDDDDVALRVECDAIGRLAERRSRARSERIVAASQYQTSARSQASTPTACDFVP